MEEAKEEAPRKATPREEETPKRTKTPWTAVRKQRRRNEEADAWSWTGRVG